MLLFYNVLHCSTLVVNQKRIDYEKAKIRQVVVKQEFNF